MSERPQRSEETACVHWITRKSCPARGEGCRASVSSGCPPHSHPRAGSAPLRLCGLLQTPPSLGVVWHHWPSQWGWEVTTPRPAVVFPGASQAPASPQHGQRHFALCSCVPILEPSPGSTRVPQLLPVLPRPAPPAEGGQGVCRSSSQSSHAPRLPLRVARP